MRKIPEWRGKTDDDHIPDRVKLRLFTLARGRCASCNRCIQVGDIWDADHKIALANGGTHSESNLQVLCSWCHRAKTRDDVATKSATYQSRKRHLGLKKSKHPMPGSRASKWKRKMDGTIVRRPD